MTAVRTAPHRSHLRATAPSASLPVLLFTLLACGPTASVQPAHPEGAHPEAAHPKAAHSEGAHPEAAHAKPTSPSQEPGRASGVPPRRADTDPPAPASRLVQGDGYDEVAGILARSESYSLFPGVESADVATDDPNVWLSVARRGAIRWRPDSQAIGLDDGVPVGENHQDYFVVDDGERPRIVIDEFGVRLLAYVDRADLRPVMLSRAPLAPEPDFSFEAPIRRGHVILEAGTKVQTLERRNGRAQVKYKSPGRWFHGWVDDAVVGTTFVRDRKRKRATKVVTRRIRDVARKTKLRLSPNGPGMLDVADNEHVTALGKPTAEGVQLVEYQLPCNEEATYIGFIDGRQLTDPAERGSGCGYGAIGLGIEWGDAASAPRAQIEEGRFLLDSEGQTVVGCVRTQTELAHFGKGLYGVPTHWGVLPVRLAETDAYAGRCGGV